MSISLKKVIIISSVHRWDDTRILLKQAVSLQRKFNVTLLIPAPFKFKMYQNIHILGLPQWLKVADRRHAWMILQKVLQHIPADIYHFHDPELIPLGLWLKYKFHKPVIYDIHEDYSAYIRDKEWIPKALRLPIALMFKVVESLASYLMDHNITATSSIQAALPSFANSTTISNYPLLDPNQARTLVKTKDEMRFLYLGSMEEIRGIQNMVEAFVGFRTKFPQVKSKLHVAGKLSGRTAYQQKLKQYFENKDIIFHGQVPFERGQELMEYCHVGIIPFFPLRNHIDAVPNKLFEYMNAGLFLLVSNFPLWEEIVVQNGVGSTFDPYDIDSLEDEFLKCSSTFGHILANSENSRSLVRSNYRWESEEKKLFQVYERLLSC